MTFASVIYDHQYWNLPTDHIIEMENCSEKKLVDCIEMTVCEGINHARLKFHEQILFNYYSFIVFFCILFFRGEFRRVIGLVKSYYQRHGIHLNMIKSFSLKFFVTILKNTMAYCFR